MGRKADQTNGTVRIFFFFFSSNHNFVVVGGGGGVGINDIESEFCSGISCSRPM